MEENLKTEPAANNMNLDRSNAETAIVIDNSTLVESALLEPSSAINSYSTACVFNLKQEKVILRRKADKNSENLEGIKGVFYLAANLAASSVSI
ncbi:MAG: hypothetical protein EOP48_00625 [Sphingobacteriales bacterium]|nr:MAG: hypothetical protein EOP48_00625 [Sphingobacteriales bacterium]